MSRPRLIYFDFAGSRGEECRIALHLAGIDFEDVRVKSDDWPAMKASTPFGAMPVLELPGKAPLAHSNAILVFIGRQHRLHPTDAFEAARHEALMCAVEELRQTITPTLRISDPELKRKAREVLAANELSTWGRQVERQLGDGPFVDGAMLQVADLKLYMMVRWLTTGTLDHVPTTVFDHCPKLLRLYRAVGEHEGVKTWLAKSNAESILAVGLKDAMRRSQRESRRVRDHHHNVYVVELADPVWHHRPHTGRYLARVLGMPATPRKAGKRMGAA